MFQTWKKIRNVNETALPYNILNLDAVSRMVTHSLGISDPVLEHFCTKRRILFKGVRCLYYLPIQGLFLRLGGSQFWLWDWLTETRIDPRVSVMIHEKYEPLQDETYLFICLKAHEKAKKTFKKYRLCWKSWMRLWPRTSNMRCYLALDLLKCLLSLAILTNIAFFRVVRLVV